MQSYKSTNRPNSGCFLAGLVFCVALQLLPVHALAQTVTEVQTVSIAALPYPQSGLRKRLSAQGKSLPPVDASQQADIPGQYYPPVQTDNATPSHHPAIVALPDCDDSFPADWIRILRSHGIGVLLISPVQAHPSQIYCSEGSLDNPKHGLTYWAFDALSALNYLAKRDGIDPNRIGVFGYGYGAGAAQLAIYRKGHAKHFDQRFKALIGLRPQCMSEMDNFAPSLLVGVKDDPFNPPAWCNWRMDRDLGPGRKPVRFVVVESGETIEKQATRKVLSIETTPAIVSIVSDFMIDNGLAEKNVKN